MSWQKVSLVVAIDGLEQSMKLCHAQLLDLFLCQVGQLYDLGNVWIWGDWRWIGRLRSLTVVVLFQSFWSSSKP